MLATGKSDAAGVYQLREHRGDIRNGTPRPGAFAPGYRFVGSIDAVVLLQRDTSVPADRLKYLSSLSVVSRCVAHSTRGLVEMLYAMAAEADALDGQEREVSRRLREIAKHVDEGYGRASAKP